MVVRRSILLDIVVWLSLFVVCSALTVASISQTLLISGESGAGKTETSRILLRFFHHVSKERGESLGQQRVIDLEERVFATTVC